MAEKSAGFSNINDNQVSVNVLGLQIGDTGTYSFEFTNKIALSATPAFEIVLPTHIDLTGLTTVSDCEVQVYGQSVGAKNCTLLLPSNGIRIELTMGQIFPSGTLFSFRLFNIPNPVDPGPMGSISFTSIYSTR